MCRLLSYEVYVIIYNWFASLNSFNFLNPPTFERFSERKRMNKVGKAWKFVVTPFLYSLSETG